MAYAGKEVVLITGANSGLGLEIARKLLTDFGDRFYCLIGCRTPSKGESAVKELHGQGLSGCEILEINVTSDDSIAAAAKSVDEKFGKLDVLHVNVSITAFGKFSFITKLTDLRPEYIRTKTCCLRESQSPRSSWTQWKPMLPVQHRQQKHSYPFFLRRLTRDSSLCPLVSEAFKESPLSKATRMRQHILPRRQR